MAHRRDLLAQRQDLDEELTHVDALIGKHQVISARGELKIMRLTRPRRVRGVLAAARKAIEQFSEPFDKNQLLAKVIEIDIELAHKKITGANIRNTLRLLTQDGVIKVQCEATAKTCAKYIKAA